MALMQLTTAALKIVAVEDEILRRRLVRECVAELLEHPCRRRMERGVEVHDVATIMLDDEEAVQ